MEGGFNMVDVERTTLWEAMAYVGTGDPDLLGHAIRFVEGMYPDDIGPKVISSATASTR